MQTYDMRHERQELLRVLQGFLGYSAVQARGQHHEDTIPQTVFFNSLAGCHIEGRRCPLKKKQASAKKPKHEETWVGRMMKALELLE